jgi:predicted DNA-binding protein (MmcQ/YjbR family)
MVEQWESQVAKVGGKVFALLGNNGGGIIFKVSETTFEILTAMDGIGQAPYFAKRQWVQVAPDAALSDAELRAYIAASHELIAARLTRKLRAELGLADPAAASRRPD